MSDAKSDTASALVAKLGEKARTEPATDWYVVVGKLNAAKVRLAEDNFGLVLEALEKAEEEEYQPGNARKCIKQAPGFERDECGRCRFCLRRKALATVADAAKKALGETT